MYRWPDFTLNSVTYRFDHLKAGVITLIRPATEAHPQRTLRVWLSYADHCFTNHIEPVAEPDKWVYPHQQSEGRRWFCLDRYNGSRLLPQLIPEILQENPYLARVINKGNESFYHLESRRMDTEYRLFFSISPSSHPGSDLRIKVLSAYTQEPWAQPVSEAGSYRFWRVVDARLNGTPLPDVTSGRRGSRRRGR